MNNLAITFRFIRAVRNWRQYYTLQYLPGIRLNEDFTFQLRNRLKFRVRRGTMDKAVFREVWIREIYAPPGYSLAGARTVVDIGAHSGAFTLFAAHHAAPEARILAFEPDADNFAMLDYHLRANDIRNVRAFNFAIAAADGEAAFYQAADNTGGHSLLGNGARSPIKVPTRALAPLLEREGVDHIDYLKIDCEGSEYAVLFNLPDPWFARIDKIGMEVHAIDGARSVAAMKTFLEGKNFAVEVRNETPVAAMMFARRL